MKALRQLGVAITLSFPAIAVANGEVELADKMSNLQYFAHKTALAIDAKNKPLADFYAHEFEEYIEDAATVETYDGKPVGKLINSMLVPSFENLEAALKAGDWKKASERFDTVVNSCNACHNATGYGFIVVERSSENPYMQSFEAKSK